MLRNDELKQIRDTYFLLNILFKYATDPDNTDLYDKTGITSKDILKCMNGLSHIEAEEAVRHIKANTRSNEYNKAHPERHRQLARESAKRRANKIKQYQKEYFQKNKKRIAEYRKKEYHRKKEVK